MPTILFNKPYGVLSHFTGEPGQITLKSFISVPNVYAAGRLDQDSEGLLILTDDGALVRRIADPRYKLPKTYWAQVEGSITEMAVTRLRQGVLLGDFFTRGAEAEIIPPPPVDERTPPVRNYHPTSWLEIILREGKKRQLRRMTAAVGYPCLRLLRVAIGNVTLTGINPGDWRRATQAEISHLWGGGV